jgi:hypothetical protein
LPPIALFPPLSSGGALVTRPRLRFHTPLIEPDGQISRIRLSDKTSRLRPRHVAPKPGQTHEPEVPVVGLGAAAIIGLPETAERRGQPLGPSAIFSLPKNLK